MGKTREEDKMSGVTYILEETGGVSTGICWREDRLFATEDDAADFCEKYVPSDYYDRKTVKRINKNG